MIIITQAMTKFNFLKTGSGFSCEHPTSKSHRILRDFLYPDFTDYF